MSPDTASEVKLEIGHVLFIDIAGYSNLLIMQQSEQMETLRTIVRGTAEFRAAETKQRWNNWKCQPNFLSASAMVN